MAEVTLSTGNQVQERYGVGTTVSTTRVGPRPIAMAPEAPLLGRRIVLARQRDLDPLAAMLEAEGATTVRCPMMNVIDGADPAPIAAWLQRLSTGGFDDLVLLTGEGLRRLLSMSSRLGIEGGVRAALGRTRKITRGPNPARVLHEIGLRPDLTSIGPTSTGIAARLRSVDLRGRRVGMELSGLDPNRQLLMFFELKGARVFTVAPCVHAPAGDDEPLVALLRSMSRHEIDVFAFTSTSQIDRLWDVARRRGQEAALSRSLARMTVAAVGPLVVAALNQRGVRVDVAPARQYYMRRLTGALVEKFRAQ